MAESRFHLSLLRDELRIACASRVGAPAPAQIMHKPIGQGPHPEAARWRRRLAPRL
jgi:hypothetical protein